MAKGQVRKTKEARKMKNPQNKKSAGPKYLRDAQPIQAGISNKTTPRKQG
jgi:hypothetical protein